MPHPCDHPAVALAITRGLPGQLQKAKQTGDTAAAQAIEAALAQARRIIALQDGRRRIAGEPSAGKPMHGAQPSRPPLPVQGEEGWAEIVVDNRGRHQRRWR
jgi:hypothetical protein